MRILVGISGGVDSAYAAKKLQMMGHDVEGAILIMHEYTELDSAREVAESIGIVLHEIDCRERFGCIKENFVNEYTSGRTPNPCIICNERVKFRCLYDFAVENGFDKIATGHYAKLVSFNENDKVRYALEVADDLKKEQSYMLYRLPQAILSNLILPLGDDIKSEIRKNAQSLGISAADRPDSQEICFLPNGGHTDYIELCSGKCPEGNFVDENGKIIGKHKGIIHYTVGQRKGLGISLGERAFVTDIDPVTNNITLSPNISGKASINVSDLVFSGMEPPVSEFNLTLDVKLRYSAKLVKTTARIFPDGRAVLEFIEPQKCAPGQSAVLYKDGRVMCGGFIER